MTVFNWSIFVALAYRVIDDAMPHFISFYFPEWMVWVVVAVSAIGVLTSSRVAVDYAHNRWFFRALLVGGGGILALKLRNVGLSLAVVCALGSCIGAVALFRVLNTDEQTHETV